MTHLCCGHITKSVGQQAGTQWVTKMSVHHQVTVISEISHLPCTQWDHVRRPLELSHHTSSASQTTGRISSLICLWLWEEKKKCIKETESSQMEGDAYIWDWLCIHAFFIFLILYKSVLLFFVYTGKLIEQILNLTLYKRVHIKSVRLWEI